MPLRYWYFVILTLALVTLLGVVTFRTGQLLKRWKPDRNLLLLPAENVLRLLMIAICLSLGWLSGLAPQQFGWTLDGWAPALQEGLLWGIALAFVVYAITQLILMRTGEKYYSHAVTDAILPRNRRELFWTMPVMVGVVTMEELLFRSLLFGGLQPILPVVILIILSSLAFGALHLPQGAWGVFGAAIAGALFCLLFLRTGSILAPITAHYVTNMVQIGQALRTREANTSLSEESDS